MFHGIESGASLWLYRSPRRSMLPSEALASRGRYPPFPGHVKKFDLLRMRLVEHTDCLGRGLQYYVAALFREVGLNFRR